MEKEEDPSPPKRSKDELVALMYATLQGIADRALSRARSRTIDATDLVHECYEKLSRYDQLGQAQFIAVASVVLRNELVDRARRRNAKKRGSDLDRITLKDDVLVGGAPAIDLLDLDAALAKLATLDERQAKVVELRFFGGLSNAEAAEVLGVTARVVADEWTMARAWLKRELSRGSSA